MPEHEIRHMRPEYVNDPRASRPHEHGVEVDKQGNGKTTTTTYDKPHAHRIEGFNVMVGGEQPHTHELLVTGDRANTKGTKRY